MSVTIIEGNCVDRLREMAGESVDCVITSPPYYGLRDYGVAGMIGLERTFDEYLVKMVAVFSEVKRVLKHDGTLWCNMGDSYSSHAGQRKVGDKAGMKQHTKIASANAPSRCVDWLKPKDLIGQPWRLAFALQADGWWLRSDIIWHKTNPMPESCTDRPTKSHEYIFLLSKSQNYYYDAEAIMEPTTGGAHARCDGVNPKAVKMPDGWDTGAGSHGSFHRNGREKGKTPGRNSRIHQDRDPSHPAARKSRQNESFSAAVSGLVETRNKRTVWSVPTAPFRDAHFATFPPALIRPCVLAGCKKGGVILDPFGGSGTTGLVAEEEGRNSILIELNPAYAEMARVRTQQTGLLHEA